MQQKKIPMRKCTGCNEMKPKKELVRVVRTPDGNVVVDKTGKLSGRGAYICPQIKCLNSAKKTKRFETAFDVAIPEEVYISLEKELTE